jgi:hypothetical protein
MDILINDISKLLVVITGLNGNQYDISRNVTAIRIYESIDSYFLSGSLTMFDDSGLIHRVPLIGQEFVTISFVKDDIEHNLNFRLVDVTDITKIRKDASGLKFRLISEKEFLSSASTFSRAFSGSTSSIISQIHNEYLKENIEITETGASSFNIVFPFIKPYTAIAKILEESYSIDGSPLFLFETLKSVNTPKLRSINAMMSAESVHDIGEKALFNTGKGGSSVRGMSSDRHQIDTIHQVGAYDTLDLLDRGAYASNVSIYDISAKTFSNVIFDYTLDAMSSNPELISNQYKLNDSPISNLLNSKHHVLTHNSQAFVNSLNNFGTIEPKSTLVRKSYVSRMSLSTINVVIDPLTDIECGDCVTLTIQQNVPQIGKLPPDALSSGKYMISAISHIIKGGKYTMSVELIRDGIGIEHKDEK